MKKLFSLSFVILSIFLIDCTISSSQNDLTKYSNTADTIISSALIERQGYSWLKELCDIGPRLSGSKNLEKAVTWTKNKMESLGFKVWLQPVMVPHWERGKIEIAKLSNSKLFKGRKLNIAALGGSPATPQNGITAEVLEVKSFEELKQKSDQAKGKIIFFSRPLNQTMVYTFGAYDDAARQRFYGPAEAAKYGAVAAIVRSITSKFDNVPHTGTISNIDSLPKVPAASIGYLDADFLSDAIKKDPGLKLTLLLDCKTYPDAPSYNIITDIKGSEFPDEVIVVGGHIDSWDKGVGAQDNGGGCMQALEVLDLFKRLHITPKRTIRCVLFANEENGSRGGRKYAEYADTSGIQHIAAIESDRGVFTPRGFFLSADSVKRPELLAKIRTWLPLLNKAGIDWINEGGSGADISHIKSAKALIGFVPDSQRYFDFHHSDNDVYEAVHPREMELGAAAIALLAYLISEEGL